MAEEPSQDKKQARGLADAVLWIVALIVLVPLLVLAVLALFQLF